MPKGFQKGQIGYWKNKKRPPMSEDWKKKIGEANKGRIVSKETRIKIGKASKGRNVGKKHTDEFKKRISELKKGKKLSEETKRKLSEGRIGEKNWNFGKKLSIKHRKKLSDIHKLRITSSPLWKGGITPINAKIRTGIEFRLWRESVFKRDDWTCQKCLMKGGYLQAHHIINFSEFTDFRFVEVNGITLCKLHHKEFHSKYGRKNNDFDQIEEFIGRKIVG